MAGTYCKNIFTNSKNPLLAELLEYYMHKKKYIPACNPNMIPRMYASFEYKINKAKALYIINLRCTSTHHGRETHYFL